jgi:hypothetical protein
MRRYYTPIAIAIFVITCFVLLMQVAQAQTTPYNVANLSWAAVTTYDDLAPIVDPVTYNVYAGRQGAVKSRVATGLVATTITRSGVPLGIWCWNVTAVVKDVESNPTADVCKEIKLPASVKPSATVLKFLPPDPAEVPAI